MTLHIDDPVVKTEILTAEEALAREQQVLEHEPSQLPQLRRGSPWTTETTEKLKRLRAEGKQYQQIAIELGVSRTAVAQKASELGVAKQKQPKQFSQASKPTADNRLQDACFEAFFRKAEQVGLTVVANEPADGTVWIRIRPSTSAFAKWLLRSGQGEKPYDGGSGVDISVVSDGAGNYPRKIRQGEAMIVFFKENGVEDCELMTKPHVHRGIDLDKVDPFKPRKKSRKEKAKEVETSNQDT